jgi:hypothetical protein
MMARQEEIEHLVKTIDDAIARAEQLELTFAAFILGMARLEVEQKDYDIPEFMATVTPFRKRS